MLSGISIRALQSWKFAAICPVRVSGEDVFKDCAQLSGGELARLRFAELALERPNLMFLDEPTNHLDIYMRKV